MVSYFYLACLIITVANLVYLAERKYKNTDRYLWTLLLLAPVVILGYGIKSAVHTPEAARAALCIIYLDSTVMPVVLLFSMLRSIGKGTNPLLKLTAYGITAIHLFSIWLTMRSSLYYKEMEIIETKYGTIVRVTSGPLKYIHYIFLVAVSIGLLGILIYGFKNKGNGSTKNLISYSTIAILAMGLYVLEMVINSDFDWLPAVYALASTLVTINYENIQSHDLNNLIGEKQSVAGLRGFCAFDTRKQLLNYNSQFVKMMPDICNVVVDEKIPKEYTRLYRDIYSAIEKFDNDGCYSEKVVYGDRTYQLVVSDFSVSASARKNGYLLELSDITDEQKRLDTVEKYNARLSQEVSEKTEHILDIQNAVVLGLANMVENRDDNTGGHVKRTSDVIKYLVDESRLQGVYNIDSVKAKDIVRAAPMHDLGKISIDSAILCKPGRLTEEEYAIMKTHAPKSGEIVKIILEGVEEQHFVDVAYNVATHHHERWDGNGYPDRLAGEEIPVEARIMAVADVYDALVSKRCYKASMSFEEAFKIMNECMGSQFDPAMEPVFIACREKLEAYYSQGEM